MKPNNLKDTLKDKIILVTGAGAGIGRTAALDYARQGATVVLVGRTTSKLESLYDEIMAESLAEPGIAPLDFGVDTADDMQKLADVIEERYGRLDGILHNAAILGDRIPFEHYDMHKWMRVMHINFTSVSIFTRILLPLARAAETCPMIFTSSSVGQTPKAYWGAYAVSKYALEGFAKLLAEELDQTSAIRISILNPGATRTGMRAAAYPNENPSTVKSAEDLMPLYQYLMDASSDAVNGKTYDQNWLTV